MCVCMDAEANEVNDNRVLAGKEIIKVYTRKNRNAKSRDTADGPSISANGEPYPSSTPPKNQFSRDDDITNLSMEDASAGQDRNFTEQEPLAVVLKGESSNIDISKVHNESGSGKGAVSDGLAEGLPSCAKEVEYQPRINCGHEAGLQIDASCQPERCDEPVPSSDVGAELHVDISSRQEPSSGEAVKGSFLEQQSNGEDLRHLPDGNGRLPRSGGKVKLPSGVPGSISFGLDMHENHEVLDILETGLSKPLISMTEDRLFIAISESISKEEIRSLKRKLEAELGQVRRVARKVDEKELQVASYNERIMTNTANFTGSDVSEFSVYNQPRLTRVNSSMDSFGHLETRSLGHLSVPVMENNREILQRTPNVFAQPHSTMLTSSVRSAGHLETRPFRHLSVSVTENNHEVGESVDREKRTPKANTYYANSDFYLEKDRLPKAPAAVKKNRFGGEYRVAFGFGGDKDGNKLLKDCSNLLQRLMKHKNGWVFNTPVDPLKFGIHDYFDIIKCPMDLGTIKTKLGKKQYKSAMEFVEDIRLVFSNAMTYNPKGHDVHTMAEELSKIFEDRWTSIEIGYRKKNYSKAGFYPARRNDYPPPLLAPPPLPSPPPVPVPAPAQITLPMRTLDRSGSITLPVVRPVNYNIPRVRRKAAPKKPKANDPDKRDMTCDEKQKLSANLQSLPPERLDAIVQIIKKRSTAVSQNDEEIEIDIDNVDAETLWELDRYVSNFKKSLSKYRRRAELAAQQAQAAASASQAIHDKNQGPFDLVSQQENIIGDGIANSAPIQVESHANGTASASSSSSSSSSDSGSSSSSDSDSDSSSADELDVGGHSPAA